MANNINELYDTLSDDPLFLANFKSSGDLEKYLQNADNVKEFKKVYGSELDEAQLMGLKKKEDTSSSNSVSVGVEPMVETPPMGVQDNSEVLGAEAQGIDLSGQPLPELGYGKGVPLPDPAKQKYVDGEVLKIQKFLEGNNPGAAFSQLRQLKMQNPDMKLTPEQNATLVAPLNKYLESQKAKTGAAGLIKTITKDAADLGLVLTPVKAELTPEQKAVSAAVKQIPAEKLKPDTQPVSEDVVGDMKEVESDFVNKFQTGLYELGANIYRIPEFAYGLTKSMMTPDQRARVMLALEPMMNTIEENNIPAQQLEKKAEDLRSKMQVVEGDISDRFAEGDYANGFTMVSNAIAESLPTTLGVIMTGGGSAGLGVMGLTTAIGKKKELDKMDIDEQDKYINAVLTGTSEALFEAVGIGSMARVSKNIFAREGVEAGREILERGILDNFDNLLKKYPVLLGPLAEGMSEVATTISQNAADKYTGVDPERGLFDGATDALIVGSAMGAGFGGVIKVAQAVLPKEQRTKVAENQQNIQRASELVQDPNITPEKKEALDNLAAKSSAENTKLEKEGLDKLNAIPEENRMEFTQLSEKAANIEDQIDTEQDPLVKKALESELSDTQTKIKQIEDAVQKQTTSEVPVQPEAISGQEVPQGQPQAEPQVAAQESEEVVDVTNKEQLTRLKERVSDTVKKAVIEQAEKGINTLKSVLPDFNIVVYETPEAYQAAAQEIGADVNSGGTFSYTTGADGKYQGTILVNLNSANERTVAHEITHGILLGKFGDTPEVFSNFHNQIKGVVSETDNARLNEFINQYDEASKPEEYLAELSGIMTSEGTTLSPHIITKIAKIVNQIVSTITGGAFTPFAETANKADVIDFFNQISGAMQKGEIIGETALDGVTEQINPTAPPSEKEIDTSSLNQKAQLIQELGLERFPEMKGRIETGKTLSELGPVTAHLTFSDRLATGKVGERTYLGGILFGAATNNFWASFSVGRVNSIIKGAPKNADGYRYLMPAILTEEAHMSNKDMLNTSLELVEKNIADGTISPADADARIKKALKKTDLKKFLEAYETVVGTNVTAETVRQGVDEAIVKSKSTFEERKSFLESILGKANIDLTKRFGNLPSFNELANGLAEPITEGFEYGDILLTIRTKGDLTAVQPQPGDPDYHPSYPWVIRSSEPVETLVFKNAYNAVDVFPKVTNKQGETYSYEDYKNKYGEGAKSRYLGYMGGRSTMSTSVTEPIVTEAKVNSKEIKTAEDFAKANEEFGTEDGQIGFKTKSQLNPKEVSTISEQISNSASEQQLEELKKLINNDVKVPTTTKTVYKLFKVKKGYPGELFPLFVGANQSVTTGEWIQAKAGELTKTKEGKTMVKSTLGPLAYRPGWHSGDIPIATHIGSKVNKTDKAPSLRSPNQVWAEVEVGDDVDWQTIANERAEIGKSGKPIANTAHITDQVPLGGSYKYKTNSNMTGSWVISGEMKVNKVLTQEEVDQINKENKAKDLPRVEPFDYETYGFNPDGSVKNPKQVVSNQVARAYLDAKETGNNPELVDAVDSTLSGTKTKVKSQLVPSNISTEYNADIAAGATPTEAMKNLLAQGYSYNQIGNELGRANIQESYNQAIAEMGKEVASRYSEAQEVRLKEIEDYLGANPVSVEQLRADLIDMGYADLEIFTAMNRNLFSQSELFQAFGETYRQTVQNAIADSRYPAQDLNEIADDSRNFKVLQSVSDLTDNFADFSFIDANILVEHMVKTIKQSGLVEAANALAEHLKGKNVDQIPLAITNFGEIASIAGRILVMARMGKKDMSELIIGSIERGPIRISAETKAKVKKLVQDYNLKKDVYDESRKTFGAEKDDASFAAMLNAEADFYKSGDALMDVLEKLKLRYWNDVLTSFSTRALLSIATTPLSLWGNIEQGIFGQVSSPVRAAISRVKGASKKTNRLSFADYYLNQSLSIQKGLSETWNIISQGKYTTPDMAEKYMDGIADVNAQKDIQDSIKFISDMIGSQMTQMTDEEFASTYDKLMYQTQNGDIKLTNGKTYTVSSAIFRSVIGTIPEITGRMLALSGDRIAFHGYKTRTLVDYIRMVEGEVKAGKRDTELQRYIAKELKGNVKNSDMDLLINLTTVLSDNTDFGKEESLKRVFMNDNFATNIMGSARSGLKSRITKNYLEYLSAKTPQNKVASLLAKNVYQGLDVITWTVSPFTRVPVNVLAAGIQNTIVLVSPFMALHSMWQFRSIQSKFNKNYGANTIAQLKTESQQRQYEKDRQELFEKRRQMTYDQSAVVTSAVVGAVILQMAISGALTPPAGADDEDRRKGLNAIGLRPAEFNSTYFAEWLAASPAEREKMMVTRGWKPGDKVSGYQNFGLIGQAMGYFSSNAYEFGKEKVKKRSYIANQQPTISGVTSFFSLGESSIQNISALQTIGLALDISKAPDKQKAAENLVANMLAATGAVAAPNALNFFAKGNAQTQMSLGQVIPSMESGGPAMLGRIGIKAASKLSRNSQVFDRKTDFYSSGIGLFGEELKLNLTGEEVGTGAAYFSAMINPFGLRSFAQVKGKDEKENFANNLYNTIAGMSMISDELGLVDEKGKPLNMWSTLSVSKNNTYEIGSGISKVTISLPFDLYKKELQILGDLRYRGLKVHIGNYENNLDTMRTSQNNLANIEEKARATFNSISETMKNTLETYETEFTSFRLRGILTEMDKRGLLTQEDKNKIELALPGQFIK
jgi:hypothetical protein